MGTINCYAAIECDLCRMIESLDMDELGNGSWRIPDDGWEFGWFGAYCPGCLEDLDKDIPDWRDTKEEIKNLEEALGGN